MLSPAEILPQKSDVRNSRQRSLLCLTLLTLATFFSPAIRKAQASLDSPQVGQVGQVDLKITSTEATQALPTISDLTLNGSSAPLLLIDPWAPSPELEAVIEGSYPKPEWSLVLFPTRFAIHRSKSDGHFKIRVPISKSTTIVTFTAVSTSGATQSSRLSLRVKNWQAVEQRIWQAKTPEPIHWRLGANLAHISYVQNGIPDLSDNRVALKGAMDYWLKPRHWKFSLSGYFMPAPLATYSIRFLGFDMLAGYVISGIRFPWNVSLQGGLYYATAFTSSTTGIPFGYTSLVGPELSPTLSRELPSGASLDAYFKFSPVVDALKLAPFSNRELASGLSYRFPPDESGRVVSIDFQWSNLTLQKINSRISSSMLSLGADYQW